VSVAPRRGTAFIYEAAGVGKHLFIVISDPTLNAERIVAVGITSWTAAKDQTCVLAVADHEFVKHKSCIAYHGARFFIEPYFSSILNRSKILADVAEPLLSKIVTGALASDETPLDVQEFLAAQIDR